VFSSEGISPDPSKVAVLQAASPPESQVEVQSFLFFTGANTDFMEGFAQATTPLTELIKEGVEFQWTPDYQRAFEQVKTMQTGDTVMAYFDPQRQTKLKMDAGPQGIAAPMKQFDPQAK